MSQLVIAGLSFNGDEFNEFQVKTGRKYLQGMFGRQPLVVDLMLDNPVFWDWFYEQWRLHDIRSIGAYMTMRRKHSPVELQSLYIELHHHEILEEYFAVPQSMYVQALRQIDLMTKRN